MEPMEFLVWMPLVLMEEMELLEWSEIKDRPENLELREKLVHLVMITKRVDHQVMRKESPAKRGLLESGDRKENQELMELMENKGLRECVSRSRSSHDATVIPTLLSDILKLLVLPSVQLDTYHNGRGTL